VIDSHTAMVYKSNIFLFGGFIGGERPRYSNTLYQFDITDILYKEVPTSGSLPPPRTDHTATMVGKNMVIFGGVNGSNNYLNDIYMLNMEGRVWSRFTPKGEDPSPRTGHACASFENFMFILGGHEEASKEVTKLYCLNIKDNTWRKFCDKYDEDYDKDAEFEYKRSMIQRSQSPKRSPLKKSNLRNQSPKGSISPTNPTKTFKSQVNPSPHSKLVLSSVQESPEAGENGDLGISAVNSGQRSPQKVTAASLKIERVHKKKAQEKRRLLGEFADAKISDKDLIDKDITKMQTILQSITPEGPSRHRGKSNEKKLAKLKVMRPGISLFSEKIGSRLEPVRLPHLDSLTMATNNSQLFVFGGDRCGLCSNDLFVLDMEDLLFGDR
jgi:Kelch motif